MTLIYKHLDFLPVDSKKLKDDFYKITGAYERKPNRPLRFCVNYSTLDIDDEMSLTAFTSGQKPELETLKDNLFGVDQDNRYSDSASTDFLSTWTPENLLKPFKGTYTEQVIKQVTEWIRNRGGIIGPIQYFEIPPCYCYVYHTDQPSFFSYHIPIQTGEGSFFIADGELGTMPEEGSMYSLSTQSLHTALNASKNIRIHLAFTIMNDISIH